MKADSLALIKPLQTIQFWLLAIAGGLIAIHTSLSWKLTTNSSLLSISFLCWGAVFSLLWEKRHTLKLESDFFSSLLGLLLIAFVLLRNWFNTTTDSMFHISPFIAAIGIALVASGVKGLKQYWLELTIVFTLNLPVGFITDRIDITTITAKFASAILTYLGYAASRQGINIIMPTGGAVEVVHGCSGLDSMAQLLRLSVLFLVMFRTNLAQKIILPIAAVAIAFVVNGFRIALMAVLVGYTNQETFEYWHEGTGSQIYFLISILILGWVCYKFSQKKNDDNYQSRELSGS